MLGKKLSLSLNANLNIVFFYKKVANKTLENPKNGLRKQKIYLIFFFFFFFHSNIMILSLIYFYFYFLLIRKTHI